MSTAIFNILDASVLRHVDGVSLSRETDKITGLLQY